MLARREALDTAGCFDERFFLFSEEVDLCWRIRQAGWDIRHLPDDDDRSSLQQGRIQSTDPVAGRVREEAVPGQALLDG